MSNHITSRDQDRIKNLVKAKNLVVFTCTYYASTEDLRLHQCIETLNNPTYGSTTVATVVVDGSPREIHEYLKKACIHAIICKEEGLRYGKGKGGALREAADIAGSLPGVEDDTWLCWQEAEKSDMMRCWQTEVICEENNAILSINDTVICPKRNDACFKRSYPIEQYHSESYGNYYMNCVMKGSLQAVNHAKNEKDPMIRCEEIDWHFGPLAFRKKLLPLWLKYEGMSYDAQLIPIVAAIRKGYAVNSAIEVTFMLDGKMKEQEEDNLDFIEKRLYQLNNLDPKLKQSWKDDLYC
jgi:hypothetical protein